MKIILSFLLSVALMPLWAQNYHPLIGTGKLWSTFHHPCDQGNPYSVYEKIGTDTTIGSITWKKLLKTSDSVQSGWIRCGFIREDSAHRVYYFTENVFLADLIYDFGMSTGDTVLVYGMPDCAYILDSITPYPLLNGENRNRYVLRFLDIHGGTDSCYAYWIEGIGSLRGLMTPIFCNFVGDDPHLICSWEHDTLKYHDPGFEECYVITGIRYPGSGIQDLIVYPNPTSGITNYELRITNSGHVNISLYTTSGVEVANLVNRELSAGDHTFTFDAAKVPAGIYLYNLRIDGVTTGSGKLTVIH